MNRLTGFVLAGLVLALVVGAGLSALASGQPDGLEAAVVKTHCDGTADPDACLDDLAGTPVLGLAPAALDDYEVTWLSGIVGVAASFLAGAGVLALARAGRRRRAAAPQDT